MRTLSSSATPLHTLPTLLHGFFGDGLHILGLLLVHPHSCISVSSCPRWGAPSAHGMLVQVSWEAAAHRAPAPWLPV